MAGPLNSSPFLARQVTEPHTGQGAGYVGFGGAAISGGQARPGCRLSLMMVAREWTPTCSGELRKSAFLCKISVFFIGQLILNENKARCYPVSYELRLVRGLLGL